MRVLVCGGRNFLDQKQLTSVLDLIHAFTPITLIIQGGATGADTLAQTWAHCNQIETQTFDANWELYGKAAGARRNQEMLDLGKPDLVLGFPGGVGTKDMLARAKSQNFLTRKVNPK